MENNIKLRVFNKETTEKFNEIISKIRKTKDKIPTKRIKKINLKAILRIIKRNEWI